MCREIKMLIVISTFFTLAMGLSGMFVNVFFWRETSSFVVIVIYNLIIYIFTPITFIVAGWLAKKRNSMWPLRIGLVFFALFFGLILMVGDRGIYYIYPLGILYGIASGFYWLAFNTLSFDFTSTNNRDTFNGYKGSFAGIAGAIAPISAAFIISRFQGVRGYYIVFAITLCLFILLIIITLLLKCQNYGSKLCFAKVFERNCEEWNIIRIATALWGFRDVVIVFIINILIIETTGSELSLGKLSLVAALISSVTFVMVQRFVKPNRRRISIFIGALFSFVAIWGLFVKVTYSTLLFYTILDALFIPFYIIQLSSATFNVINRAHEEDLRVEYMINKELAINCGRVMSALILLILLTMFKNIRVLNYFLIFIGVAPLISGYFLVKLKKVLSSI